MLLVMLLWSLLLAPLLPAAAAAPAGYSTLVHGSWHDLDMAYKLDCTFASRLVLKVGMVMILDIAIKCYCYQVVVL